MATANVELMHITDDPEGVIELAGRTCYKSHSGNRSVIRQWIRLGHESVIEHASATFRLQGVSRALTHQLVRHRLASYSQQSQRYVDEVQFHYVVPGSIKANDQALEVFNDCMKQIQSAYEQLRGMGIKKEDARFVLPNACMTEIVVTMNFRELRHFFQLRMDSHAQWEIRGVAAKMLRLVVPHAPNVFYDLVDDTILEVPTGTSTEETLPQDPTSGME